MPKDNSMKMLGYIYGIIQKVLKKELNSKAALELIKAALELNEQEIDRKQKSPARARLETNGRGRS